jgi:hypothetical protein
MPAAAVSDLVIQEREMDLVASTYGRSIYVMNIRPIQQIFGRGVEGGMGGADVAADVLFEPPEARLPWINDTHSDPDLRTVEKVPLTFFLTSAKNVKLSVVDAEGREVKTWNIAGKKGFNQLRWDLVVRSVDSPEPYFIRYREFAKPGEYVVRLTGAGLDRRASLTVMAGRLRRSGQ